MELKSRNTNSLQQEFYPLLFEQGEPQDSRNGPVIVMPEPCTFTLTHPRERVNFSRARDANPFFHLMEAVAMLGNWNHVGFHAHFAKNMVNFSDDGQRYNAYYGTRLRQTFGQDQLERVVHLLKKDPNTRQAVAQIWHPDDLNKKTKDKACNLLIMFSLRDGALEMTTVNRSNDMIWGYVSGANVVHFSFFQEYVACALGVPVGVWHHFTNNAHVYENNPKWDILLSEKLGNDLYSIFGLATSAPLFDDPRMADLFNLSCQMFARNATDCITKETLYKPKTPVYDAFPFLKDGVINAFNAWQARKVKGDIELAEDYLASMADVAPDWMYAMQDWVNRRTK